jgi:hypothetical protein
MEQLVGKKLLSGFSSGRELTFCKNNVTPNRVRQSMDSEG